MLNELSVFERVFYVHEYVISDYSFVGAVYVAGETIILVFSVLGTYYNIIIVGQIF